MESCVQEQERMAEEPIAQTETKKKQHSISPVLKFRLVICAAVGVFAIALKMLGGSGYEQIHEWYDKYASDPVTVTDSSNSEFLNQVFNEASGR